VQQWFGGFCHAGGYKRFERDEYPVQPKAINLNAIYNDHYLRF
jgi:hypothetical protein